MVAVPFLALGTLLSAGVAAADPIDARCTNQIDYAGDPRGNAEINSIGASTGVCPVPIRGGSTGSVDAALSDNEQKFVQRMLNGSPDGSAAPLVLNPGRSVRDLVQLGHTVVKQVRLGTNPYDEQASVMRANPALTGKQGAWLIVSALWLFDPAVARFYYKDTYAGVLPPGCWIINQIDLKCNS